MRATLNEDEINRINRIEEKMIETGSKEDVIINIGGASPHTVKNIKTLKAREKIIEADGHFFEVRNITHITFGDEIINCT